MLFRDFMNGTSLFLEALESRKKGAVRILSTMGSSTEEGIRGARELGYPDMANLRD
jgi:hypothetical protein